MNKIVATCFMLCCALLVDCVLGVESYKPISTDESNRLDYRGTTETTVKLRVVDENGDHIDATIQAFECEREGYGHPQICPFLAETTNHIDGVYTFDLPDCRGTAEIRIITSNHGVIPIRLPKTSVATIDLGTLEFNRKEQRRPEYGFDFTYREFRGRILDEDNNPIEGLLVHDIGRNLDRVPFAIDSKYEYTDSKGQFAVLVREIDRDIYIHTHVGPIRLRREFEDSEHWDADSTYDFVRDGSELPRVHLETEEGTEIVVKGKQANEVGFSLFATYPYAYRQIPFSTLKQRYKRRYSPFSDTGRTTWIRASTEGHLSRLLPYPSIGRSLTVDISKDKLTAFRITSKDGVIKNAKVSIVEAGADYRGEYELPRKRSLVIDTFFTDRNGRFVVKADPGSSYVALVTAKGFAPRASSVHIGKTNEIELVRSGSEVTLRGLALGESVRVNISGTDTVAAYFRTVEQKKLSIRLPPATYDAIVENVAKRTSRGMTFELSDKPLTVDLRRDVRPLLKINLPTLPKISESRSYYSLNGNEKDIWYVGISRDMPRGGVSNAAAVSYFPMSQTDLSVRLPRTSVTSSGTATMRLPGTGRWFVFLSSEYGTIEYWLFTEIRASANETVELVVPPLKGHLTGVVQFDKGEGFFHHGIAGPRMMLLAHDGRLGQWNVVPHLRDILGFDYDKKQDEKENRFSIKNLPIGKYRIEHYLDEHGGGSWGGLEVSLLAEEVNDVGDLSAIELGSLRINVVDGNAQKSKGMTLYIKNRMYDAWASFTRLPTTGVFAGYPLSEPPIKPVHGRTVTVHGVQEGSLELMLEDSLGVKHYYLATVSPDREIQLVVP